MLYSQWNTLLFNYYFEEGKDHEVFLGIDKDSLIDYIIDRGLFQDEIERVQDANPGRKIVPEDYIWTNFTQLFKKREYCSKDVLFEVFQNHLYDSKTPEKMPTIFPCLALFIMPLANNPEMDPRNFYDRLTKFLRDNNIIRPFESIDTPDLRDFRFPSLSLMWENLEIWAQSEGYHYFVKSSTSSGHKYVGPFMAESLLTATQRDKFKIVFYEAGLTPDQEISDEIIARILHVHHKHIGFTDEQGWKKVYDKYKDILISEFRRQYDEWDGNTIIRLHENNRRITKECGFNKKLYLCMTIFRNSYNFYFKARFTDAEPGSEFSYIQDANSSYDFTISNDGYADSPFRINNLSDIISSNKGIYLRECSNPKNRLSFQNEEFFLFEKYYDTYTSSCKLKLGGKFYFLVRGDSVEKYESWLEDNSAQLILGQNQLSPTYSLYLIPEVKVSFPGHNSLNCSTKISVSLSNTFVLKKESRITSIYRGLPTFFEIDGANVIHDEVTAIFEGYGQRYRKPLEYEEASRLWKMQPISNKLMLGLPFTLYINGQQVSRNRYLLDDFTALQNEEYREISYDAWGNYSEQISDYNGLMVEGTPGIGYLLKDNMAKFGKVPVIEKKEYEFTDYLLYWMSSRASFEKSDVADAISVQVQNAIVTESSLDKWNIRTIIDNYCRLGYINYAYADGKHIIAPNKPTLILLPAKVNRTSVAGSISSVNCAEKYFKVLLTGARTPDFIDKLLKRAESFSHNGGRILVQIEQSKNPLYPQRILLWAEDLNTIRSFTEKYEIQFQNAIYANLLLNGLGSVEDYESYIVDKYKDFNDTNEGFTDLVSIDYNELAQVAAIGSYYKKDKVYKSTFNRDHAVVTYFPGRYMERTILWRDGKQYPVDKYWGHFIGMKIDNAKVIRIDETKTSFQMPLAIRLPILYARALTMMTGEIPECGKGTRIYQLCENPFANAMSPDAILKKLNQK